MKEDIRELLEQSLAERVQIAFMQMRHSNPRVKAMVEELIRLSAEIEYCSGISAEARELLQRYLNKAAETDSEFQKYLYIQGARDCVTVLRKLDVIK